MASGKDSFILYTKYIHVVRKLSDEMAGKLYKMILEYVNDNNPQTDDFTLELIFEPIKQDLKEDLKKWESVCERNRENGKNGGRPRNKPKKPSGLIDNPKNPNEPKKPKRTRYDSDSDSDSDMSIDNDIIKENTCTDEFSKFNSWLKKECPNVSKLKTQMTEEQMNFLIAKYTKERFFDILLQMENKKDLNNKYTSVYLTANNWLKR